ncbi:hypothetical protein Lser_V15G31551 [Lactuca serriola]
MSNSRSTKKIFDDENPCGCGRPSWIWTSRTEDHPEKKVQGLFEQSSRLVRPDG